MGKAYIAGLDDGHEFLREADFALQALPDLGLCEDGGCAFGVDARGVGEVDVHHFVDVVCRWG